jgi:hypothetical protein
MLPQSTHGHLGAFSAYSFHSPGEMLPTGFTRGWPISTNPSFVNGLVPFAGLLSFPRIARDTRVFAHAGTAAAPRPLVDSDTAEKLCNLGGRVADEENQSVIPAVNYLRRNGRPSSGSAGQKSAEK